MRVCLLLMTVWTSTNDAVWERTHRFGGWISVLAGLSIVAAVLLKVSIVIPASLLASAYLVPAIYSYFSYRRLKRPDSYSEGD